MVYTLLNILSTIVIFQLLLLAVFLFSISRGKSSSNRLLATFFLLLAFNIADGLLVYYGFYKKFPAFAHLEDGFVFLVGPVLFFYTKSVVYRDFTWKSRHFVHLLPFFFFTILFQLYYHLQPTDYQELIQSAIQQQKLPPAFYFFILLVYGHVGSYLFFAHREITFYRKQIRERFSQISPRNLDWLLFMIFSVAAILVLSLIYSLLPLATKTFLLGGLIGVMIFIFLFVNSIVWKALNQPAIFSGVEESVKEKYGGASVSEHERAEGKKKIDSVMTLERGFLNADLTLEQLAERTNMPARKLSQFINEYYNQSFFDFINSYRIEEAQRILRDSTDAKLTVLEVMYQSGFNSKSSFNTLFKKKTGKTPSEFRRDLQK